MKSRKESNSSASTRLTGQVLWEELLKEVILHITPLYSFKGQVYVFEGRVNIVGHSSCRTSAILNISVLCDPYNTEIWITLIMLDILC